MKDKMTLREARSAVSELLMDKEDDHLIELYITINNVLEKEGDNNDSET